VEEGENEKRVRVSSVMCCREVTKVGMQGGKKDKMRNGRKRCRRVDSVIIQ
jgi:hypothetical protein